MEESSLDLDLDLADRYQAFSAELLRLSLLGITAYGFLAQQVLSDQSSGFAESMLANRWLLVIGLVAFAISAGAALAHRYYSTDVVAHLVYILRQRGRAERGRAGAQELADAERVDLKSDLKLSGRLLVIAAVSLAAGALAVAISFGLALHSA